MWMENWVWFGRHVTLSWQHVLSDWQYSEVDVGHTVSNSISFKYKRSCIVTLQHNVCSTLVWSEKWFCSSSVLSCINVVNFQLEHQISSVKLSTFSKRCSQHAKWDILLFSYKETRWFMAKQKKNNNKKTREKVSELRSCLCLLSWTCVTNLVFA